MKHRKYNYVVGFSGENQCVYGRDKYSQEFKTMVSSYVNPMTRGEAEEYAKRLTPASPVNRYVFKLVPVMRIKESP